MPISGFLRAYRPGYAARAALLGLTLVLAELPAAALPAQPGDTAQAANLAQPLATPALEQPTEPAQAAPAGGSELTPSQADPTGGSADPFLVSMAAGAAAAVGLLAALAAYTRLAPRLRNYAAYLKTRQLHRRVDRQRRGRRGT